jgi:hypothetical protein
MGAREKKGAEHHFENSDEMRAGVGDRAPSENSNRGIFFI